MNEEEQGGLAFLEEAHKMGLMLGLSEADCLAITKTNGDVPEASMREYCANHNTPIPEWMS